MVPVSMLKAVAVESEASGTFQRLHWRNTYVAGVNFNLSVQFPLALFSTGRL
jgi:hypothetical protein